MSVLELFCAVDDFLISFAPQLKASQLAAGKQRARASQLDPSEIMTILIHFHQSHGALTATLLCALVLLISCQAGTKKCRGYFTQQVSCFCTRRRPWKVAREAVALDQLSNGRFMLGVGSGDAGEAGFSRVNEVKDAKERAKILDEALDIILGLWSGEPFSYQEHYFQVDEMTFLPTPVQKPRIPILVGGGWPLKGPSRRAARYDGCCLYKQHKPGDFSDWTPDEVQALKTFMENQRSKQQQTAPYEIKLGGRSRSTDWEQDRALIKSFAEVGVSWWVEYVPASSLEDMRKSLKHGPLRIE